MRITPNVIRYEFIGTETEIKKSRHSGYVGIVGKVVDETRNTFIIEQKGKKKTVVKEAAIFHFKFPDGTVVEINGKFLVGRPEDRLKKRVRRLW